ncbi:hypothetical protein FB45DRAFT_23514 [Roridomyces roridus]|uniref:Uncharacterized protein n=1 Tax=Roridomyces roridus TaxID=1738132 RepID=A0AAD7CJT6_9AGAR|nr:hypothetical protein FB45DRAFT_23514 [Roridomyces roridus]
MLEVDGITPHLFIVLHSEQAADLEFSMDIPNEGDPIHIVPLASFFGQGTYSAWVGSLQPGRRHNVLRMSAEMAQAPIVVQSLKMLSECHKSCFLFSQRGGLRDVAAMARRLRELAHKYFGRSSFNCALTWNPKDGRLRVAVGADSSNGFTFVDEGQPLLGEQMPSYQHSSTDRLLLPIVNFKERLDGCPWDEPTTRAVVKVIHDIVEEILLRQVTGEEGRVLGVVLREHARKYFRLRRRRESEGTV